MPELYYAQKLFHQGRMLDARYGLLIEGERVLGVFPRSSIGTGIKEKDLGARILCPGWIDLQLNGCGGGLFNRDLNFNCLEKMLRSSLRHGATSILPTLISSPDADIERGLELIAEANEAFPKLGKAIIGMHLEGPFISAKRRGAHPLEEIRSLDDKAFATFLEASRAGTLSFLTVAAGSVSPKQVAELSASGLTVSIGHCEEPYEGLEELVFAGARCITHIYNATGDIKARNPGTLSLALHNPMLHAGLIADGHHVAKVNAQIAQRLLGERLFLVTDATATPDGGEDSVHFGGQTCKIEAGMIRNEEGSLAGSALTMQGGVEILAEWFSWEDALAMASSRAAAALNPRNPWAKLIGSFLPASMANFLAVDADMQQNKIHSIETWLAGEQVKDL